jgi:hypothetical protein
LPASPDQRQDRRRINNPGVPPLSGEFQTGQDDLCGLMKGKLGVHRHSGLICSVTEPKSGGYSWRAARCCARGAMARGQNLLTDLLMSKPEGT